MAASNGTFTDFEDALRAFESGVNPDTIASGTAHNYVSDADWNAYQASAKTPDDLRTLQYTSMNSLGFVGYQVGEALLIDLGYYKDDFYYGNGAATNTWDGMFVGANGQPKDGITSLAALKTSLQEGVILAEFGHNLQIIENGLAAQGHTLADYLNTTQTYHDNTTGDDVPVLITLTGLMAAAHLRGAYGTLDLLLNHQVSSDENGTSILTYIINFGGYDAPPPSTLENAYAQGTTLNLAEQTWNKDFDHDGTIAGVPIGGGGQTFIGHAGNETFAGTAAGVDTVDYSGATGGVTVNLATTSAQAVGGGQGSDKLTSIENLIGSNFADTLTGNASVNKLVGGDGDDVLDGKGGADLMIGGTGNDKYYVDNAGDRITEGAGDSGDKVYAKVDYVLQADAQVEYIFAAAGAVGLTLTGNAFTHHITGNAGIDHLNGGSGNEIIDGQEGADVMAGGLGNDTYYVDNAGDQIVEAAGGGTDLLYASVDYTLGANAHVEYLYADAGSTGLTLTGNAFSHHITGNAGVDHLNGGSGNDILDGMGGADFLSGGAGDDRYYVDNAGDQITEVAGGGTDKVYASTDYVLQVDAQVEYLIANAGSTGLTLTGNAFSHNITGNAGVDHLNGGSGNDTIDGKGGADVMAGGAGDDIYYVDDANDQVIEIAGNGTDKVITSVSYALAPGSSVEYLVAKAGSAALRLTGNELANHIVGSDSNDVIIGGGGADVLTGGTGMDKFAFMNLSDSLPTAFDRIQDFTIGEDHIDLTHIDANSLVAGSQPFTFIGAAAFTHIAGQLRAVLDSAADTTTITADVDGNGTVDFQISLKGAMQLHASDFIHVV